MRKVFLALALLGLVLFPLEVSADGRPWSDPVSCPRMGNFGEDYSQINPNEPRHSGIDWGCPVGTPVSAPMNGVVYLVAQNWGGYSGWSVWLKNAGVYSFLTHLSKVTVSEGQDVRRGDVIALSGTAGTGPHLHMGFSNQAPEDFGSRPWREFSEAFGRKGWVNPDTFGPAGDWDWTGKALAILVPILVGLLLLAGVLNNPARAGVRFAGRVSLWVLNWGLEAIGWVAKNLSSSKEQRRRTRQKRRRFKPWREGLRFAVQLMTLMAMLALANVVIRGAGLEKIPQTKIAKLLSWASRIDPEEVAYGVWPAFRQWLDDSRSLKASALSTFSIQYWNEEWAEFWVPEEVWQEAQTAVQLSEYRGCDPLLVVAVIHSENPTYDSSARSVSAAQGIAQFIPGTWEIYQPWPGADPANIRAAVRATCGMVLDLQLAQQTNESDFVRRFTGTDGGQCWNCPDTDGSDTDPAIKQASYAWRLWNRLKTGGF